MAASVVYTYEEIGYVKVITMDWTSHTDGTITGTTPTKKINGQIVKVEFDPDSGATQPSDNYDLTVVDENNYDILAGQGANLSQTNTTAVVPGVSFKDGVTTSIFPQYISSTLQLVGANCGASKGGIVKIFYIG